MARMSIYIPDQLKVRMDPHSDRLNWSNVAQAAFETELSRNAFPEEATMQDVIERLKASKAKSFDGQYFSGKKAGSSWAMQEAEYDDLKAMSFIDASAIDEDFMSPVDHVMDTVKFGGAKSRDTPLWNSDTMREHSQMWIAGFVNGAKEVWEQVADKL